MKGVVWERCDVTDSARMKAVVRERRDTDSARRKVVGERRYVTDRQGGKRSFVCDVKLLKVQGGSSRRNET